MQLLDGYAFLLVGVIDLYEATLEPEHLDFAIALAEAMLARFYDAENGGFWQSAPGAKDLILRVKEDYDGAEPSGNSVAMLALLKLGKITDRKDFTQAARRASPVRQPSAAGAPGGRPHVAGAGFLTRRTLARRGRRRPGQPRNPALLRAIHCGVSAEQSRARQCGAVEPFARTLPAKDGPAVYLCTGTACQAPTTDPATIRALLRAEESTAAGLEGISPGAAGGSI